jgi:hypothetical protein
MVCPFKTKMERSVAIRNLRNTLSFPREFEAVSGEHERSLIQELLQRKPDDRPSAIEILSGKYLPPGSFPDLGITSSVLESPDTVNFIRLMDILFHQHRTSSYSQDNRMTFPGAWNLIKAQNWISSKIKK